MVKIRAGHFTYNPRVSSNLSGSFDEARKTTKVSKILIHVLVACRFSFSFLQPSMAKKIEKNNVDWYIINKVKEIRTKKGLSQEDLAAHLNISASYIGQVESPNFRAKYKTLHLNELAKLFGCSPKEFWPEKPI